MNSALYEGTVRHRRLGKVEHAFELGLFLAYVDLDELPALFDEIPFASVERANVLSFRRRDYLGPADVPLDEAVRDLVEARTGRRPSGPIRLLTHLRMLGHCFNPVSFYYCFDEAGRRVETIVSEITNTPWGECHATVLPRDESVGPDRVLRFRFAKDFHVSPFMPMDHDYDWRFTEPGARLLVHMENHHEGGKVFDATLTLTRRPLLRSVLGRLLARWPFGTLRVLASIYFQAFRLWWKGAPFHAHPRTRAPVAKDDHHDAAEPRTGHPVPEDRTAARSRRLASTHDPLAPGRARRRVPRVARRRRREALRR